MTKRVVKKHELQILKREIRFLEDSGVLPAEKAAEIQGIYEEGEKLSFTRTLLYVGSILVGAGILSLIASNWDEIGKLPKFLFIIGMFIASNFAAFRMERNYPKTSRSFYYLGVLVYGAGIFLVGQMFHFGGAFEEAFLWWSIGILPLAWVLRDKWILLASSLFALIYMTNDHYLMGQKRSLLGFTADCLDLLFE
ncbi:DUF2157 domain-containing protein [Neobacillus sp. PS3-34]|uniref:DUF2157 domain-containing protein n=1 Tax=Neobacillus sp. PS3-34 TaxID=3070678 RepID=UPI0027E0B6EF|nr:DUF2157 domain-containing protein [Neobacillus sp. PS3-34]WML50072.1 DUF2157 domain-containing protein [Neobacillus sp. PS3-34]